LKKGREFLEHFAEEDPTVMVIRMARRKWATEGGNVGNPWGIIFHPARPKSNDLQEGL